MSAPAVGIETFEREWVEGWNAHDPDALAALCHPDIVWEEPAPRRILRGREEARAWIAQNFVAFPDLRIEVVRTFRSDEGDAAASRWVLTGTHDGPLDPPGFAPTHMPVRVEGADFMEFERAARPNANDLRRLRPGSPIEARPNAGRLHGAGASRDAAKDAGAEAVARAPQS